MEEIKTCNNNQKMSVYCKTCVCKSCEQVIWLEQENAELKEELNQHLYGINDNMIHVLYGKPIKYWVNLEKALEEIRGINNQFFDMNYGFDEQNISYDVKEVATEIQDKINEVIGNENNSK